MNKRERVLAVLDKKPVDSIPASFWFHFVRPEDTVGEGCVKAHLDYYRATDIDFIKIMSDGLGYPLKVTITCADDWFNVKPLPHDDPFYTESIYRCRRINEELNGECCTFYNMFSPFNVVRERDVFTEECLAGRSWDTTLMAHLRENEEAVAYAMNVIAEDLAYLARMVITEGHCEGIYQSVQGAEKGRMSAEEYSRIVTPGDMKIINAAGVRNAQPAALCLRSIVQKRCFLRAGVVLVMGEPTSLHFSLKTHDLSSFDNLLFYHIRHNCRPGKPGRQLASIKL